MSTPDDAFLAEVDNFLNSCDASVFSVMRALTEDVSHGALLHFPEMLRDEEIQVPVINGDATSEVNLDANTKHGAKIIRDRKRRLAYHERQKLERESLHRQVDEMSMELDKMQRVKEVDCAISVMAWKTVAIQQLEARQAAEMQHQHLQAAVQSQARLIKECGDFVQQSLDGTHFNRNRKRDDDVARQHKRIRLEPSDTDIYDEYLRELNSVYAQTDKIFETNRAESAVGGQGRSTWKVNSRTGYFEFVDRRTMPYNFHTVALKFRVTTRVEPGRIVSALQRIVGRRYIEDDRVVVVWRSFTVGEGFFRGMHSDETGWCVINRSSDERAVLDIFMRNIPMHFGDAEKDTAAVEQFPGLVCSSGSGDIFEMTDSLEKMSFNE